MKIKKLEINNFRGINKVSLNELGNVIVIAGQNGSGKSCIFDAIRLLKSAYGGYQANEWHQWMGEFLISPSNNPSYLISLFNDPQKELSITCEFELDEAEKSFIICNIESLLREKLFSAYSASDQMLDYNIDTGRTYRLFEQDPETLSKIETEKRALIAELSNQKITGKLFAKPGENLHIESSSALSIAFRTFRPSELGVIDFHGPQRHFSRESVQGINLSIDQHIHQRSQTALYNYGAKYTNIKGEMAASYIKEMLSEAAGLPRDQQSSLTNTLKELFTTFFPDKNFLGPQPTIEGKLTFPVVTGHGRHHDLDELSSGEKEILYGYLRIRNSAPKYSIILLDEPELHLNPRLIRGLPQFYRKHLGENLKNQLWLVTHSDALLREVVGRREYNVFHMTPFGASSAGDNQVKPLSANEDIDLALADLVGDLAAYQPNGKIVIFEGGGDSDFDRKVVAELFPEIHEKANLISGSNKVRVRALQEVLARAADEGRFPFKVYCVTDKDLEPSGISATAEKNFSWDVYHIENYFLNPTFIARVMSELGLEKREPNWVESRLQECARETLPEMIRHELSSYVNRTLTSAINTKTDPNQKDIPKLLFTTVTRSLDRINESAIQHLSEDKLRSMEENLLNKYKESIATGTWKTELRGRDILKKFISKFGDGIKYETFRNLILARMADSNHQPTGMINIVNKILIA